ncbi:hypothetical protein [Flavobacterium sp. BFFFF1]|uniref:hypothetical protein n=1 Tax=Flavobacterium sp. BFFFF1 TaxID=2015557 RepID=UPI0025C0EC2D|nr:hypothetical protein [Flavobacterium sp. BFFFF1]
METERHTTKKVGDGSTRPKSARRNIGLAKTKFYIHNMLITNRILLENNNINNLILF